jgi:hypothetical protein
MSDTLVFIDDGFLSKLSKFFGEGKYIKLHRKKISELIARKESTNLLKTYLYTAPPFQRNVPTLLEEKRRRGYDRFVKSLIDEGIEVREGRCQRLKINGEFVYTQKGVDTLLTMDLVKAPFKLKLFTNMLS